MLLFGAFSNHLIHRRCTKTARHFGPMNDSAQSPQGRLPNQRSMSGARMNASVKIIRFHRAAEQTKLSAATAAHASLPSSLRRRAISLDERVEHVALADSRGPPPEEAIARQFVADRITRIRDRRACAARHGAESSNLVINLTMVHFAGSKMMRTITDTVDRQHSLSLTWSLHRLRRKAYRLAVQLYCVRGLLCGRLLGDERNTRNWASYRSSNSRDAA